MTHEVIGTCPICSGQLKVTELKCTRCQTILKGQFELSPFCKLPYDQRNFALVFIKNRGNIKEIEKELGISYPTVRNRLDELVVALGFSVNKAPSIDKQDILRQLSEGEITKDEAIKKLTGIEA